MSNQFESLNGGSSSAMNGKSLPIVGITNEPADTTVSHAVIGKSDQVTKTPPVNAICVSVILRRLRRLVKGAMYTGIGASYILFVGWMLFCVDWKSALLALFVISVAHQIRVSANSVEKIGWQLTNQKEEGDVEAAKRLQSRLFWVLYLAIGLCSVFLVAQTWYVSDFTMALGALGLLSVVEVFFVQIRRLNKITGDDGADYGD